MSTSTRRQYLKFAGTGLAAAVALPGLAVAQSARDRVDYERTRNGDIEFEYLDLSFESDDGDFELQDEGVDFEVEHRDSLELTIDTGSTYLDLEMDDNGDEIELEVASGNQYIEFEWDNGAVEFETIGLGDFEDDEGSIEFEGDHLEFEWDDDDGQLEISGDIELEVDMRSSRMNLEYKDDDIEIEYDDEELEYVGRDVEIEWEFDSSRDKFDARMRR
jgi:hypothetical protein